jgi:hypothetical protein
MNSPSLIRGIQYSISMQRQQANNSNNSTPGRGQSGSRQAPRKRGGGRQRNPQPSVPARVQLLTRIPRAPRLPPQQADQIGAVVRTRLTRVGMSDIRSHRVSWVAGYTFVGNGTNGTANSVYFQTASSTWLVKGQGSASSGQAPIAGSDLDLGATYVSDIEKHYARKVVKRMWIHVDSLQPSTSNNMMAVIGISRGPGGMAFSVPISLATAAIPSNTVNQVSSMKNAFPVDSWEHKSVEISEFIAGGSGAKQNEFEIQGAPGSNASIYVTSTVIPTIDGDSLIPACIAVAGNCTTTGLQNTKVHQITIEQEVDLLDYVGGMAAIVPSD